MHLLILNRLTGIVAVNQPDPGPDDLFPEISGYAIAVEKANELLMKWEELVQRLLTDGTGYALHEGKHNVAILGATEEASHAAMGRLLTGTLPNSQPLRQTGMQVVYDYQRAFPYTSPLYHRVTYAETGFSPLPPIAESMGIQRNELDEVVAACNDSDRVLFYDKELTLIPSRLFRYFADADTRSDAYDQALHDFGVMIYDLFKVLEKNHDRVHWIMSIPVPAMHQAVWKAVDDMVYTLKPAPEIDTLIVTL